MNRVTRIEAKLQPPIDTQLLPQTTKTPTFVLTFAGPLLTGTPHLGTNLDVPEALQRFDDESRPLLAVCGHQARAPVTLSAPIPYWVDTADPAGVERRRGLAFGSAESFIVGGPTDVVDAEQRVAWATADPVYAELLILLARAHEAANPRPIAFQVVERVTQALGAAKNRRSTALARIGLSEAKVVDILKDQSSFDEDRHAQHPPGTTRPPIDAAARSSVLSQAGALVRSYEAHVLGQVLVT